MPLETACTLLALLVCVLSGCISPGGTPDIDEQFERMVGIPLNSCLFVTTDLPTYQQGEYALLRVENKSKYPVDFPNRIFGLQVFRYDAERQAWVTIDLPPLVESIQTIELPPGEPVIGKNYYPFPVNLVGETHLNEQVRLYVVGRENIDGTTGQYCGAYVDIVVIPPPTPPPGHRVVVTLLSSATTVKVGDTITFTITLSNQGETLLINPSCVLSVGFEGEGPLEEIKPENYSAARVIEGESISLPFVYRAVRPGTVWITGGANYSVYSEDTQSSYREEISTGETMWITVTP